MVRDSDADDLRNNALFQNMLAALKSELYDRMTLLSVNSADEGVFRAGVLTGLTRALEVLQTEENLAGVPPESSEEKEE